MGNCNHRKYLPHLVELLRTGVVVPSTPITQVENVEDAIDAQRAFDRREPGWLKIELAPA
jgi:threonine dehydrogenase-like Zn-dependent dehydrogenase